MADVWPNGCRAAVSLTYDDGLPVHHEEVAPALEARGLRGTFYAPIDSDLLANRDAWVRVAQAGHELGNHTIFHPCRNPGNAREWPPPHRNLCDYTLARWEDEVRVANRVLTTYDGKAERTFGKTCGNLAVGPEDAQVFLDEALLRHFVASRGAATRSDTDPNEVDFARLGTRGVDGKAFDEVRTLIDDAAARGAWLILVAHGVGRDHPMFWARDSHTATIDYLAAQRDTLWVAPVIDIALHLKRHGATAR